MCREGSKELHLAGSKPAHGLVPGEQALTLSNIA